MEKFLFYIFYGAGIVFLGYCIASYIWIKLKG